MASSKLIAPLAWVAGSFAGLALLSLAGIGLITVCAPGGDGPPDFLVQGTPFPREGGADDAPSPQPTATERPRAPTAVSTRPPATPTRPPPTPPPPRPTATLPAASPTRAAATATSTRPTATLPPASPTPATGDDEGVADFGGRWLVTDTVTSGSGAGQTFTFEIVIIQVGDFITGGNSGLFLSGEIEGRTARADYVQPALGLSGEFVWTLGPSGAASGTFTSTFPNAGTSTLTRR